MVRLVYIPCIIYAFFVRTHHIPFVVNYPSARWIFSALLEIRFPNSNNWTSWRGILKGLSEDGGRAIPRKHECPVQFQVLFLQKSYGRQAVLRSQRLTKRNIAEIFWISSAFAFIFTSLYGVTYSICNKNKKLRKNFDDFVLQILTSMLRIWQGLQGVSRRNLRAEPDTRDQQIFANFCLYFS